MTELKIDEENIKGLLTDLTSIIADLTHDITLLGDKNEDIFLRYISLNRLGCVFVALKNALHMSRHMFKAGFDVNHPMLQTEKAKQCGWDKPDLPNNPFFEQEKCNHGAIEMSFKDLPDHVKESIIEAIKNSMKNRENHVH